MDLENFAETDYNAISEHAAAAICESAGGLADFIQEQIEKPATFHVRIRGPNTTSADATSERLASFDFRLDCLELLQRSSATFDGVDLAEGKNTSHWIHAKAVETLSISEKSCKLTIERRLETFDENLISESIQDVATSVAYGGSISVEMQSSPKQTLLKFSGKTDLSVATTWRLDWPLVASDNEKGPVWRLRIGEAMVLRQDELVKLSDPSRLHSSPLRTALRMNASRESTTSVTDADGFTTALTRHREWL